jgi:uncharacterized membrane protein
MCQNYTARVLLCQEPFTKLVSCVILLKYQFVTGFVLYYAQVGFVIPVLLAKFQIKKQQLVVSASRRVIIGLVSSTIFFPSLHIITVVIGVDVFVTVLSSSESNRSDAIRFQPTPPYNLMTIRKFQ